MSNEDKLETLNDDGTLDRENIGYPIALNYVSLTFMFP